MADQVDAGVIHRPDIRLGMRVAVEHGHHVLMHAGDAEADMRKRAVKVVVQMPLRIPQVELHARIHPHALQRIGQLRKAPRRPVRARALHARAVVGHAQGAHPLLRRGAAVFAQRRPRVARHHRMRVRIDFDLHGFEHVDPSQIGSL